MLSYWDAFVLYGLCLVGVGTLVVACYVLVLFPRVTPETKSVLEKTGAMFGLCWRLCGIEWEAWRGARDARREVLKSLSALPKESLDMLRSVLAEHETFMRTVDELLKKGR